MTRFTHQNGKGESLVELARAIYLLLMTHSKGGAAL